MSAFIVSHECIAHHVRDARPSFCEQPEAAQVNSLARTVNAGTTATKYVVEQGCCPAVRAVCAARSATACAGSRSLRGRRNRNWRTKVKTIKVLSIVALTLVSACAGPAISDIATDKVKVESAFDDPKAVMAEAERGCAIYNRTPVALSKRRISTGGYSSKYEFLFACMDPTHANVTPRTS